MSRTSSITEVPKPLLSELHRRLVESGFAGFEEHSAWLKGHGYNISKSSIHRYATGNKSVITAANDDTLDMQMVEHRIRCLEVAVLLGDASSVGDLIKRADELMMWAVSA